MKPQESRRRFIIGGSVGLGALTLGFVVPSSKRFLEASAATVDGSTLGGGSAPAFKPNAFIRLDTGGRITVLLSHSEMGQGVWTTLPLLIAEELDVDLTAIHVEHGPVDSAYGNPLVGGMQATVGSSTVRTEFIRYRQAGAAARAMLLQAAAARFGVPIDSLRTERGTVVVGSRSVFYGDLAADAGKLPVPNFDSLVLKSRKDWRLIGTGAKRLDSHEKITGKAVYGIDVKLEGMLTAVVARAPKIGGTLRAFDAAPALAVRGVRQVVQVPSGVAVLADTFWAAKKGRDALKTEWNEPAEPLDSGSSSTKLSQLAREDGFVAAKSREVDAAMRTAVRIVETEYRLPYLAHAAMEPLNCTVRLTAESCELWLGTQMQTATQRTAAQITGLKPEQVKVHTTFLGGAFGRRGPQDFVQEAVHVARASGVPVKVMWTREDDMSGGYYRAAFTHRVKIGLDRQGMPVAWDHTVAGQSIFPDTVGVHRTSVEGLVDSAYLKACPAYRVETHSPRTAVPVWFWRSVGHSHTGFVVESLIDELASAAGKDPLAYRRLLLRDSPRHLGVLEAAANHFGWSKKLPPRHGRGIAVHESYGSFAAQAVEVSVENDSIRVHRVVCAIDCGIAVNPDNVRSQMESAIVYGLTAALHGRITFKDGAVQESNFHNYPVLRMDAMPAIEVVILNGDGNPGGAGEPGTPPIAPAISNAIFSLVGKRLREMPLSLA